MFITELDKQAIRLGAYIVFLEQLIEQQKKELDATKNDLVNALKPKDVEKDTTDGS